MENHSAQALKVAGKLRREMTLPEVLLWRLLRGGPAGIKFRRQHPIGAFVLDFYCAEKRIGIEIGGIAHDMGNNPERDSCRDRILKELDVDILRISASEVLNDVNRIADAIVRFCADRPPPSALRAATSPSGGGFYGATN